jgi:hypothetical protein
MGAIRLLPGTTHGSVAARQGYDPQDTAVLTMKELEKWLTLEIVGKYPIWSQHSKPIDIVYSVHLKNGLRDIQSNRRGCFIIALLPTHPQIMLRERWGEPSTSSEADVGSGTSNSFVTGETEAFRPASPAQPQGSDTRGLARRGPRVSNLVHLVGPPVGLRSDRGDGIVGDLSRQIERPRMDHHLTDARGRR